MSTRDILASVVVSSAVLSSTFAQTPAPSATPRVTPAGAQGLDAVDDSAVLDELGARGLELLMDRYLQTHQVAPERQESARAMLCLRRLLESRSELPEKQEQEMIRRITASAATILPTLKDPRQLMQLSTVLIREGVQRHVNTIEYWGENPASQAAIRPVAELVARVLDQCAADAGEEASRLELRFGDNPPKALVDQWQELDSLSRTAQYSRYMADYYRAISIDKADPRRGQIALGAIQGLQEYDTPDSNVQPLVRLCIGKLQMVTGDYLDARKTLATLAKPPADMKPAPDIFQQYEARYFSAVCDLLAGDLAATSVAAHDLGIWEQANLPGDKSVQDGASAAFVMLRYRLASAEAAAANDAAARRAASQRGAALLRKLAEDRPDLRGLIYAQLVKMLPDDAPVEQMEALMLQALLQRGLWEPGDQDDKGNAMMLERAVAAATEILKRKEQGGAASAGVDEALVDAASLALPQLYEKQGKDLLAARASLDYVASAPQASVNGQGALNSAIASLNRFRIAHADDAEADRLMGRALSLAVEKLQRRDLAYDYGRRLQREGRFAKAAGVYRLVPARDARALPARFFLMQCVRQQMAATADKAQRAALAQETQRLCMEVSNLARSTLASAATDADKASCREMDARSRLTLAELLRQVDPAKTLQTLRGMEELVAGLAADDELVSQTLFYRVYSMMAMGKNAEASDSLLALLKLKGGGQGAQIIDGLARRLDADLENARRASDSEAIGKLLKARADLSGPLVQWAATNPDPQIRQCTYRYMVIDAATKQQAAVAETDPRKRAEMLRQALGLFQALLSPENIARWRQTVDAGKVDLAYGDTTVLYSIALLEYDLGNYRQAHDRLGRLLEDRKLGTPRNTVSAGGETVLEDNPQYWEATYKLYRSNVELASAARATERAELLAETRSGLKLLYIREGEGVGGEQWKAQFETLRRELIPDFVMTDAATTPTK